VEGEAFGRGIFFAIIHFIVTFCRKIEREREREREREKIKRKEREKER